MNELSEFEKIKLQSSSVLDQCLADTREQLMLHPDEEPYVVIFKRVYPSVGDDKGALCSLIVSMALRLVGSPGW